MQSWMITEAKKNRAWRSFFWVVLPTILAIIALTVLSISDPIPYILGGGAALSILLWVITYLAYNPNIKFGPVQRKNKPIVARRLS